MKVKSVRFYQAVALQQKMITHLAKDAPNLAGIVTQKCDMELVENMGVLIETDKDKVIVTFNNLSTIQLYKDEPKAPKK